MYVTKSRIHSWRKRLAILLSLLLLSTFAEAIAPIEAHFIMGMDVQGQRLNLYKDCQEGYVTCDNMLLVAPNLGQLLQINDYGKRLEKAHSTIVLYPANTKHSTCKDGVTPCRFQGYSFEGEEFNGFIDTSKQEISIYSHWTTDTATLSYQQSPTYLPLISQADKVNRIYEASDKALNDGYIITQSEVRRLYGKSSAQELSKEQVDWIKQRSNICGADVNHQPRNQAETVCFIQKNASRMNDFFLWID